MSREGSMSKDGAMAARSGIDRREFMRYALATGAAAAWLPALAGRAAAAGGTLNFADVGVGDPGGDWSKFTGASGWGVNLVAIGNAPSAILTVLVAGGGTSTYDIINIV